MSRFLSWLFQALVTAILCVCCVQYVNQNSAGHAQFVVVDLTHVSAYIAKLNLSKEESLRVLQGVYDELEQLAGQGIAVFDSRMLVKFPSSRLLEPKQLVDVLLRRDS